jgi:hypothetical protein
MQCLCGFPIFSAYLIYAKEDITNKLYKEEPVFKLLNLFCSFSKYNQHSCYGRRNVERAYSLLISE